MPSGPVAEGRRPAAHRLSGPAVAFAAVTAATAYVAEVDPGHPGHYPVCPFLRITGWWCPACGGLRCVHALSRGELWTALHDNALATAACLAAVVCWVRWTWRAAHGRDTPPPALPGIRRLILPAVLVLGFTVLRNLSYGAFLAP